jgi:hypothetical protein
MYASLDQGDPRYRIFAAALMSNEGCLCRVIVLNTVVSMPGQMILHSLVTPSRHIRSGNIAPPSLAATSSCSNRVGHGVLAGFASPSGTNGSTQIQSPDCQTTYQGVIPPMKSQLLQRISSGLSQSPVMDSQQKSTEESSVPEWEPENPLGRVSPPVEALVRKDSPGLLKHGCRPATS